MTMVLQRTYNSHTHSVHAATKTSFKNHNGVAVLRCCCFFFSSRSFVVATAIIQLLPKPKMTDWMRVKPWKRKAKEKNCYTWFGIDGKQREREREKIWLVISFLVVLVLCVWFVVHNDSVRGWIMPPFYESFELVPSEVLRSSVGRSLFMAIRCTRHASEKRIKKIHRFSSSSPLFCAVRRLPKIYW